MTTRILLQLLLVVLTVPALLPVQEVAAAGPVIARGAERDAIKATHIVNRPYRPMHFYGNTVRRRHARDR